MPTIAILPSALADQIAAGEVVERPASAVKELVENAVDAGARSVEIEVADGGRAAIRVSDDGCGMARDDALLALERHATSKIRSADDLVGIGTFGFRGEALPSIASVSALTLETAPGDGAGTVVRVVGGSVLEVVDGARRRGTTVSVARLFHNVPARLKFLRSARSEWRAVTDAVTSLALAQRGLHLTLTHDGVRAMTLPGATSLRSRVGAIWGGAYADALVDVDDVSGTVYVTGLAERPSDVGTRTRRVVLVINGRAVRDAGLVRAAEAAYRSTIPAGLRPSVFLDITVSAESVDVNVHPAKAEVRFRDRWVVERAVENAVRRALGTLASSHVVGTWVSNGVASPPPDERVLLRSSAQSLGALDVSAPEEEVQVEIVPPLVQLRRTYLMYEHDEGVVLIDQHSAHERVLFEQFMSEKRAAGQRLLFPLTLHMGPAEGDAFEEHRELFETLGFEIEGFGGHSLLVRSVPMPHARFDAERCLRETLDALTGDRIAGTATRHERLVATVACKAAVKAGDNLSAAEMRALYLALGRTTLPAHDVHGRATIVRLSWDELERRFGRR
ncbi:MAG TPA: DNA mismatch repair endonuclease MutL [Gemmatimonadaceae bacterium]|nr:DNA mismatch repair endonuclease MutL [Gemmatimonadaceae bacterium]